MPLLLARYWPHLLGAVLLAVLGWKAYGWAYDNGAKEGDSRAAKAELALSLAERNWAQQERLAEAKARSQEHDINKGQTTAQDEADDRHAQIQADYDRRIAGADRERDRLSKLWGACETNLLSSGAELAGAIAEQDRLRSASAARVVRATELAQSERDEAIDRYNAVEQALRQSNK